MDNLLHKDTWNGNYNDFGFEIVNWGGNKENWNYYIYFTQKSTPAEFWDKLKAIQNGKYAIDYSNSFLTDFHWHCGITFCEKIYNSQSEVVAFKAGCDYSHYWDEGIDYDLNYVLNDCKSTIDSIKEVICTS